MIAQLVEHPALNRKDAGSTPAHPVFFAKSKKGRKNMTLEQALKKYKGRRICSMNATECQQLIGAYGDQTNELNAGHDPYDANVWQAVLMDNMDAFNDQEII